MRDKINQYRNVGVGASSCIIVLAVGFIIWWEARGSRPVSSAPVTQAFYSDDDGKTWFIDDLVKVVPFDHHGGQAVRAEIFRCAQGKPFVGYLERYSDAVKAKITSAAVGHPDAVASAMMDEMTEVKRPVEAEWINPGGSSQREYTQIITVPCPEGETGGASVVSPSDPDNGASD